MTRPSGMLFSWCSGLNAMLTQTRSFLFHLTHHSARPFWTTWSQGVTHSVTHPARPSPPSSYLIRWSVPLLHVSLPLREQQPDVRAGRFRPYQSVLIAQLRATPAIALSSVLAECMNEQEKSMKLRVKNSTSPDKPSDLEDDTTILLRLLTLTCNQSSTVTIGGGVTIKRTAWAKSPEFEFQLATCWSVHCMKPLTVPNLYFSPRGTIRIIRK